ncbi:MAG: hypothetical protein AABY97_06000, partial [Chloroflexota bacterium]
MNRSIPLLLALTVGGCTAPAQTAISSVEQTEDLFVEARLEMVEPGVIAWGVDDPAVIEAMRVVP